jgi:hypothetical protein
MNDKWSTQDTTCADHKELTLDDLESVAGGEKPVWYKSTFNGFSVEEPGPIKLGAIGEA